MRTMDFGFNLWEPVHLSSHGADHLRGDILQSGVIVTTGQGGHTTAVAEHIMTLVLMLAKNAPCFMEQKREHSWERSYPVIELARSAIGLVGFGSIGKRVARYAQAFGMRVLAYDPFQSSEQAEKLGVALVEELDFLLAESDFVALTLPLTEETRGMIGEQALKKMKPSAYLINACRGRLVDEPALIWALGEKRLAGAGLDVFELMPLLGESPLWDMENVIITPQSAAASPYLRENTNRIFIENLRLYLAGEQLLNVYHRSRGFSVLCESNGEAFSSSRRTGLKREFRHNFCGSVEVLGDIYVHGQPPYAENCVRGEDL